MQIIRWLLKVAPEPPRENGTIASSPTNKKRESCTAQSNEVVPLNHHGANQKQERVEKISSGCENFNLFTILQRKDIAKTCFYSTLNLKTVQHPMKMKKEDIVRGLGMVSNNKGPDSAAAAAAAHVGNTKVLPITDAALSSNHQYGNDKKRDQKGKSDRTKTMSKMKELLRWASAAKSEKGGKYISRKVLQFRNRNRGMLKSVPDDYELSSDSPKISFRWDMESCSTTTSSVYSSLSMASSTRNHIEQNNINSTPIHNSDHSPTETGNWITTDSQFVVLEL